MIWTKHIYLRLLLVLSPVLMALAPARAQDTVFVNQTVQLSVVNTLGVNYTWELYNNVTGINLANVPGNCPGSDATFTGNINTGPAVNVTWLTPGTYFYKVTARKPGCSMNLKLGKIVVIEALPTAIIDQPMPVCTGDTTSISIELTGTAPWSLQLSDGTSVVTYDSIMSSPFTIPVSPGTSTNYTVVSVSDAYGVNLTPSNTITVVVKPRPVTTPIIQYGP